MKVLKFGGSSVGSSDKILNVKKIIESQSDQIVVVVSAMQGITDKLIKLCDLAADNNKDFFKTYNEIEVKHHELINSLFEDPIKKDVQSQVNSTLKELSKIINSLYILGDLTLKIKDRVISTGEMLLSYILSRLIDNSHLVKIQNYIKNCNL